MEFRTQLTYITITMMMNMSTTRCQVDHDSDAVYFCGGQFYVSNTAKVQVDSSDVSVQYLVAAHHNASTIRNTCVWAHELTRPNERPLFLLHAALRL